MERPPVGSFCRISLSVPDNGILEFPHSELPRDWQAHPAPDALKGIGDDFIRQGIWLALKIPSVIVPDENNYLINPAHPRFSEVEIIEESEQPIDDRLV